MRKFILILLIVTVSYPAVSHFTNTQKWKIQAIQDNSFIIEEAFNQEVGVIHNIFNTEISKKDKLQLDGSFTSEWPVGGEIHQLSFTLPYFYTKGFSQSSDVMLNYRLRILNSEDYGTLSPRISLSIPLNEASVYGFQMNLPYSIRASELFIFHLNIGSSYKLTNRKIHSHNVIDLFWAFGADFIVHENVNFMLEYFHTLLESEPGNGKVITNPEIVLCPAVRFAVNIGKLQVVPGFGVPFIYTKKDKMTEAGIIVYLSFEFPLY